MKNKDNLTKKEEQRLKSELKGQRLKSVLERYGLKQVDLTRSGHHTESQVSGWINGSERNPLSEAKATELINEFFPEVRLSYLMGDSEYMTDYDWADVTYNMKNIVADSMWAIIENSLRKQNKHLHFHHRQGQHLDSVQRIKSDCYYTIDNEKGETLKKLSPREMVEFEEKIQEYCDFLTEKHL